LFIIRGWAAVTVEYQDQGKKKRVSLGRLAHRQGIACRYHKVLYQGTKKERIDITVYRERGFKEPWFLLVPALTNNKNPILLSLPGPLPSSNLLALLKTGRWQKEKEIDTEYLIGYEGTTFAFTGNTEAVLLSIRFVHPTRDDAVRDQRGNHLRNRLSGERPGNEVRSHFGLYYHDGS
jgi:hypothetical protein